jgi:hypothetical protein
MKNLSDVSVHMSDEANVISPKTDGLKLHSGVNFMELDIDDLGMCVFTLKYTDSRFYNPLPCCDLY